MFKLQTSLRKCGVLCSFSMKYSPPVECNALTWDVVMEAGLCCNVCTTDLSLISSFLFSWTLARSRLRSGITLAGLSYFYSSSLPSLPGVITLPSIEMHSIYQILYYTDNRTIIFLYEIQRNKHMLRQNP